VRPSSLHFYPLAWPFLFGLVVLFGIVIVLLQLRILEYAYEKIGIRRQYVFLILLLSLVGSAVNIPVAELPPERVVSGQEVVFFGMRYVVPVVQDWPGTILAVNLGGAIIPTALSIYLWIRNRLGGVALIAIAVVTIAVHLMATPVPGVGIAVPTFLPPIVAAVTALLLSRRSAPALAYVAGTLGTLIGADLLNLPRIQGLGAPVASIGGAGTFDGVFLTGILAVLLA
jgi:uncharacterized membrane protein